VTTHIHDAIVRLSASSSHIPSVVAAAVSFLDADHDDPAHPSFAVNTGLLRLTADCVRAANKAQLASDPRAANPPAKVHISVSALGTIFPFLLRAYRPSAPLTRRHVAQALFAALSVIDFKPLFSRLTGPFIALCAAIPTSAFDPADPATKLLLLDACAGLALLPHAYVTGPRIAAFLRLLTSQIISAAFAVPVSPGSPLAALTASLACCLHDLVWRWIRLRPLEFVALSRSEGRLRGGPEATYVLLHSAARHLSPSEHAAIAWPALSAVSLLMPDCLLQVLSDSPQTPHAVLAAELHAQTDLTLSKLHFALSPTTGALVLAPESVEALSDSVLASDVAAAAAYFTTLARAAAYVAKDDLSALRHLLPAAAPRLDAVLPLLCALDAPDASGTLARYSLAAFRLNPRETLKGVALVSLSTPSVRPAGVVLRALTAAALGPLPWHPLLKNYAEKIATLALDAASIVSAASAKILFGSDLPSHAIAGRPFAVVALVASAPGWTLSVEAVEAAGAAVAVVSLLSVCPEAIPFAFGANSPLSVSATRLIDLVAVVAVVLRTFHVPGVHEALLTPLIDDAAGISAEGAAAGGELASDSQPIDDAVDALVAVCAAASALSSVLVPLLAGSGTAATGPGVLDVAAAALTAASSLLEATPIAPAAPLLGPLEDAVSALAAVALQAARLADATSLAEHPLARAATARLVAALIVRAASLFSFSAQREREAAPATSPADCEPEPQSGRGWGRQEHIAAAVSMQTLPAIFPACLSQSDAAVLQALASDKARDALPSALAAAVSPCPAVEAAADMLVEFFNFSARLPAPHNDAAPGALLLLASIAGNAVSASALLPISVPIGPAAAAPVTSPTTSNPATPRKRRRASVVGAVMPAPLTLAAPMPPPALIPVAADTTAPLFTSSLFPAPVTSCAAILSALVFSDSTVPADITALVLASLPHSSLRPLLAAARSQLAASDSLAVLTAAAAVLGAAIVTPDAFLVHDLTAAIGAFISAADDLFISSPVTRSTCVGLVDAVASALPHAAVISLPLASAAFSTLLHWAHRCYPASDDLAARCVLLSATLAAQLIPPAASLPLRALHLAISAWRRLAADGHPTLSSAVAAAVPLFWSEHSAALTRLSVDAEALLQSVLFDAAAGALASAPSSPPPVPVTYTHHRPPDTQR
jgi:hypothetical protein